MGWCRKFFRLAVLLLIIPAGAAVFMPGVAQSQDAAKAPPMIPKYFRDYDLNQDGFIDVAEWKRRGNFERLDRNKDGRLELSEFAVIYRRPGGKLAAPILSAAVPEMDPSIEKDSSASVSGDLICSIARSRKCSKDAGPRRGLFETGLGPAFPEGAICPGIDEYYAMDYSDKANKEALHGGIDIPVPYDTPMLAAAAGTVVFKTMGQSSARGIEIVLRHSPADTGLPMWTYTQYGHLGELPAQVVGQRVRMGEVLGPTSNTGSKVGDRSSAATNRRPGIHYAVWYSASPRYRVTQDVVVPEDARWMDPNAFYRRAAPFDSESMKALPEADKFIAVSIMYLNGTVFPADTKVIWPYACGRARGE